MNSNHKVIINTPAKDRPRSSELSAAFVLAEYFKCDIIFLRPVSLKSPDFKIKDATWELKSPTGKSKNTIANNFKYARKQSKNIIFDLRRCKLNERNAIIRIKKVVKSRRKKNGRVLVISKDGKVLDILEG